MEEVKSDEWFPTYLHVAFCDIERGDTSVSETASNGTTEHALGVVRGVMGNRAEISVRGRQSEISYDWTDSWRRTNLASHLPGTICDMARLTVRWKSRGVSEGCSAGWPVQWLEEGRERESEVVGGKRGRSQRTNSPQKGSWRSGKFRFRR